MLVVSIDLYENQLGEPNRHVTFSLLFPSGLKLLSSATVFLALTFFPRRLTSNFQPPAFGRVPIDIYVMDSIEKANTTAPLWGHFDPKLNKIGGTNNLVEAVYQTFCKKMAVKGTYIRLIFKQNQQQNPIQQFRNCFHS